MNEALHTTILTILLGLYGVLLLWQLLPRAYQLWRYKKASAEFVRWVRLNPRDKREYPEYCFSDAAGERHLLINRGHMNGDDPHPMSVLYDPLKPKKALFYTFRYFCFQPMCWLLAFTIYCFLIWGRSGIE